MKHFIKFLVVAALFSGCAGEETTPLDTGSAYFPLKKGIYQVYAVTETRYTAIGAPETSSFELMTEIIDSFPAPEGYTYVILRSRRSVETQPWEVIDTWSARKNKSQVVVSEGNTAYIKVIFPIASGSRWDGNAFNSLGEDEYELKETDSPGEVNGMTFEKTLTIEQERNEDLIVYKDDRKEIYARDVGLVYREITQLNYCTEDNCLGQQKVDNGIEMKLQIKQYGKH